MKSTLVYKRRLPHIQPLNGTFFVTFRLKMQLPADIADKVKKAYCANKTRLSNPGWSAYSDYFTTFDNYLDYAKTGPVYLSNIDVGKMVAESIHYRDKRDYDLICYTIMSNHVHMVIGKTRKYLFKIMHSLKRYTGYEANKMLNRKGPFWQPEYSDHLIRDETDLANHIKYTIENPVKAKLVAHWKDWPNSYKNDSYKVDPIANRIK